MSLAPTPAWVLRQNARRPQPLTIAQEEVLKLWLSGSASPFAKGIRGGSRMPEIRQCVRKGLLETQSGLPFAGRKQRLMVLLITPAGRHALETEGGE